MPVDDEDAQGLYDCIDMCEEGTLEDGWGEVSYWPREYVREGDWTSVIWRSFDLAEASAMYSNDVSLQKILDADIELAYTGRPIFNFFELVTPDVPGSFPSVKSKGADGQLYIQSYPDQYWAPKDLDEDRMYRNGGTYPEVDRFLEKAGYLLITGGQNSSTGRLTAVAGDARYVGGSWMPVLGISVLCAKALSVWFNSTVGRLQLMRNAGKTIIFPAYSPASYSNIRIPNIKDERVLQILSDCWYRTRDTLVPQFRDGECEVRRLWDEAVADAMDWDAQELTRLRLLLHQEPHVRGLGYGQYSEEAA